MTISELVTSRELERLGSLVRQRPKNRIQNFIEALTNIFTEESQHMIAVLLKENILSRKMPTDYIVCDG